MRKPKIYFQKSFKITGRDIIVEIQHKQAGLLTGTILISQKSNLSWEIISRILYDNAIDNHIQFEGETINQMHLSFESIEKKESFIQGIVEKEEQEIYQYWIKPIGHDQKPEFMEELEIKTADITAIK